MSFIVGIDPGQSGGVSFIDVEHPYTKSFVLSRTHCTIKDIAEELSNNFIYIEQAFLEAVRSMPGQGVASTFKFGTDYGMYKGILMALNIPFVEVAPQRWQRTLGCLTGGNKNITKLKAQQLFPSIKITHANADALLIGLYGLKAN